MVMVSLMTWMVGFIRRSCPMKQIYKPLCFIAAIAAMSLTSCQKDEFKPDGNGKTAVITVHAVAEDLANATKTHIEGSQVLWDADEQMKIILFGDSESNIKAFDSESFTPDADNTTGTFTVTVNTTTHTKMAGIYPSSAAGWVEAEAAAPIALPSRQAATASSYDPAAYVMITAPDDLKEGDFTWEAYYKRIAALNKFTLTNLPNGVKRVIVTFPEGQNAAGTRNFDLTTGEPGDISNGSNAIDVRYASVLGAGSNDIWFTSWAVDMKEGDPLIIKAETADKAYTKTFTAKQTGELLRENYLNSGTFDMSDAKEETLTPVPEFEEGEYWIMANTNEGWKVAEPVSSSYGYLYVDNAIMKDGAPVSTASNVFTITAVEGGYTIQDANGKYYYMTGSYNSFNITTNASQDGSVWSITPGTDDKFEIVNVLKHKIVQYSTEHSSFGAYETISDSNILPSLVKAVYFDVTPSTLNVQSKAGTTSFNIASSESWEISSSNEAYTVSPSSGNGRQTITVTYPANEGEESVVVTFTITSESGIEKTVTLTQGTEAEVTGPTELFISEYVEGSSNNKYIEIYNPTDHEIDLSAYTVRCYTNGKATATTQNTHNLEGTITAKSTLVLKNSSAKLYTGEAITSAAANFNGEDGDAISLDKNGEIIDVWGVIGSTADYGKDVTMRRKPDVTGPSATLYEDQWTTHNKDDVSDLGKHTMNE